MDVIVLWCKMESGIHVVQEKETMGSGRVRNIESRLWFQTSNQDLAQEGPNPDGSGKRCGIMITTSFPYERRGVPGSQVARSRVSQRLKDVLRRPFLLKAGLGNQG